MSGLEFIGVVSIVITGVVSVAGVIYLIDKFSRLFSDVRHLIEMRDLTVKGFENTVRVLDEQASTIDELSNWILELESVKKGKK
jgi:hypothetical protein